MELPVVRENRRAIFSYYSRDDIKNEIFKWSQHREVVGSRDDGSYIKRPNILQYPMDIVEAVKNGVVTFHYSVEHWKNPMIMKERIGWDFILDIDSHLSLEESKITALQILKFLKSYGIRNVGVKFSGRRGFHLSIPFENFPKEINFKKTKDMYPELPRTLSSFIRERIKDDLMRALIKKVGMKNLATDVEELNPYQFVDVEKDWGERHLFRAPFSLNHKSWLVSLPIRQSHIEDFDPREAIMENVKVTESFFKFGDNATDFIVDALDWVRKNKKEEKVVVKRTPKKISYARRIGEEFFPPCIKNILAGLKDGRKRSLFTLITFLRSCNWEWDEIEKKLEEWNKKNAKSLSSREIHTQIRWHMNQGKLNPPNCSNDLFYGSIGICPKEGCEGIKNPMSYVYKKLKQSGALRRTYKCKICGKEFKSKRALSLHMRVHKTKG